MKKLILLLFWFLSHCLLAQESKKSEEVETITVAELRDHVFFLSSDELEGRQTGSLGFIKAQQYVITQLRGAGLSPIGKTRDSTRSYYQDFTIHKYSPDSGNRVTVIKNGNERIFSIKDFVTRYSGNSFETKESSRGLAFVGAGLKESKYGIDDYKNIDVKGKWAVVLAFNGVLPLSNEKKLPLEILRKYNNNLVEKRKIILKNAKDAGAIGIINIFPNNWLKNWENSSKSGQDFLTVPGIAQISLDSSFPIIFIDSSMIDYLFNGEKYNPLTDKEPYRSFVFRNSNLLLQSKHNLSTIPTSSVVALIEGSDPVLKNEFIILGAHLDHLGLRNGVIFNGANDNASGSAGVLEIAEALIKSKPKRSVICVLYTGEELGLLGSRYFTENPPVPLKDIIANINIDMIGCLSTDVKGLAPIGASGVSSKLKEVIIKAGEKNKNISLDWAYADANSSIVSRSDNYSFQLKNIPAVNFFTGFNTDYHKATDDAEKIDYETLQKSCKLIYDVILELANGNVSLRD